jgi:hypothetical protein
MSAQIQRSDNPDAGYHVSRPEPNLIVDTRSRSFNVICVTFGSFTLVNYFIELLQALNVILAGQESAFASP